MRVATLTVLVALAVPAGAASAATPAGFTEAKQLEPAASYVAGKPATVYCADSDAAWAAFLAATGREGQTVNGSAVPGSDIEKLSPVVCRTLAQQLARRHPTFDYLAPSILALTHEATHLRGTVDEGATDCDAVHLEPRIAVRFFGIRAGKQLRALMAAAWAYRGRQPAAYRSVC